MCLLSYLPTQTVQIVSDLKWDFTMNKLMSEINILRSQEIKAGIWINSTVLLKGLLSLDGNHKTFCNKKKSKNQSDRIWSPFLPLLPSGVFTDQDEGPNDPLLLPHCPPPPLPSIIFIDQYEDPTEPLLTPFSITCFH